MDVEKRRPTKDVWIAWKLTWIRRECAPNPNKIGNRTGILRVASNSKKNSLLMVVFFSKKPHASIRSRVFPKQKPSKETTNLPKNMGRLTTHVFWKPLLSRAMETFWNNLAMRHTSLQRGVICWTLLSHIRFNDAALLRWLIERPREYFFAQ